jgi:hypothetical protein
MPFDEIDRLCARRVQNGLKKYGILDLLNDPRDFRKELADELLDGINYARWANVKGQIPKDEANGIVWILKSLISNHLNCSRSYPPENPCQEKKEGPASESNGESPAR